MSFKRIIPLALVLSTALPALSQVQLFESEVSGLVPYLGYKWNSGISEITGGLEYTIDGRTTLGFNYSMPLKDTLSFDSELKAYELNPYGIFEFIEPDNLKTFSFAIRFDLIHEGTQKDNPTPSDPDKLNSFSRTQLGGGPIFALRIFNSDKLVMIPAAAYEFFYVTYDRTNLQGNGTSGSFPKGDYLWHDVIGSCAFHFIFNEFNGLSFEPKVTAKFGKGRASDDLLNISANLGYVLSF
ncbi:MAG: hypothetical protein ABI036_05540 [Fibrobacteria bacterium]